MSALSDYVTGTISLTNGQTAFTGTGTGWMLAQFKEGDTIIDVTGATEFMGVIATIDANGAGTLTKPWEGPTLAGVAYRMRYQPDGARTSAQARNLVDLLGNGNLAAEAAIDGTGGNWLSYFTGIGTKAKTAITAKARALLAQSDNAGMLAEIGAQAAGNYQAADSDLTAIAALATTAFGRGLLTLADQAAGRTALGIDTALAAKANLASVNLFRANQEIRTTVPSIFFIANNQSAGYRVFGNISDTVDDGLHIAAGYAGGTIALFRGSGAVQIPGTLSKGGGTFLIDHPLDPFNKDLAHGFVEAPRYDLIYRGVVQLDQGRAIVDIDGASNMTEGTFAALTTNAVVTSLQNQDGFARLRPGTITGGKFEIICEDGACTDHVSWVVIAERNDAFVKSDLDPNTDSNGRFVPERDKED